MSAIVIEMSAKGAQAWAEIQKVAAAEGDMEKGFQKISTALKNVQKEQDDWGRKAKQVLREIQTPQEKYNAKVRELETLLGKGKLTQDQFNRAVAKSKEEMQKATGGCQEMTAALKAAEKEEQALGEKAKQVLREIQTPQERYNAKIRELDQLLKAGKLSQDQYGRAVRMAKDEMERAGLAGQKAFGSSALSQVKSLAGALGVGLGLAGVIAKVNEGYQVWQENIREIAKEANKASNNIIAFAALQEGGTKAERVGRAADLGARYGIADRGEAFNTIQALQSALGGDFEKGLAAAETVFAATKVGIPLEKGRELEVIGASQGMEPGEAVQKAYVAGQLSARDPAVLANAAAGLAFWEDKDVGFAAAGVLAGSLPPDQLATYLTRGGTALSQTGPLQPAFEEWGMGEATQFERIAELSRRDIKTPVALEKLGMTEIRELKSVVTLVNNYDTLQRYMKEIPEKAGPGLFATQRAEVEKELPMVAQTGVSERLGAEFSKETAFGPGAGKALAETIEQQARALAFRRLEYEQSLWMDLIKGEGAEAKSTRGAMARLQLIEPAKAQIARGEQARIQFAMEYNLPLAEKAGEWSPEFERAFALRPQDESRLSSGERARRAAAPVLREHGDMTFDEALGALKPREQLEDLPESKPMTREELAVWRVAGETLFHAAQALQRFAGGGPTLRRPNE